MPQMTDWMQSQQHKNMKPLHSNILWKPLPSSEISESGLFIPETARTVSDKGIVVKVGEGTEKKPTWLKEGMIAYRVHNWGQEIMINGELHFLMDEGAILSIE